MPSFLDILAPSRVPDTHGVSRRDGPADIESCIQHDLQTLLNARRPPDEFTAGFTELVSSILTYGLKDFAFTEMESREKRELVARHIESVIAAFEPRLVDVRVEALDPEQMETKVRFHITASIRGSGVDSAFNNTFEWTTGHHEVEPT
jgi:type VI secretion system lysozyme-like protein